MIEDTAKDVDVKRRPGRPVVWLTPGLAVSEEDLEAESDERTSPWQGKTSSERWMTLSGGKRVRRTVGSGRTSPCTLGARTDLTPPRSPQKLSVISRMQGWPPARGR